MTGTVLARVQAHKPRVFTQAHTLALSAAQVRAWADPVKRARRTDGVKASWEGRLLGARKASREWQDAIIADYIRGDFIDAIAARHGCSRAYPAQIAKRRGLDLPKRRPGRRPK